MLVKESIRNRYENVWLGRMVRVKYIDKHCFLGRELHPDPVDLGKFGIVTELVDCSEDWDINFDLYAVFLVKLNDGTFRELCEHELDYSPLLTLS